MRTLRSSGTYIPYASIRAMPPPTRTRTKPPDPDAFTPRYICPICHEDVPPNPGRQRLWHDECEPGPRNPNRQKRICPGCGGEHTVPKGYNSAFHPGDVCKGIYRTHHTTKPNTTDHEPTPEELS